MSFFIHHLEKLPDHPGDGFTGITAPAFNDPEALSFRHLFRDWPGTHFVQYTVYAGIL